MDRTQSKAVTIERYKRRLLQDPSIHAPPPPPGPSRYDRQKTLCGQRKFLRAITLTHNASRESKTSEHNSKVKHAAK